MSLIDFEFALPTTACLSLPSQLKEFKDSRKYLHSNVRVAVLHRASGIDVIAAAVPLAVVVAVAVAAAPRASCP